MQTKLALVGAVALLAVLAPQLVKSSVVPEKVDHVSLDQPDHDHDGHQVGTGAESPAEKPTEFKPADLVELSRILQDTKTLSPSERCEAYEVTLRQMFMETGGEKGMDTQTLFQKAISSLSARTVLPKLRKEQPYVQKLRECLELPVDSQNSNVWPSRTVVAGPDPDSRTRPEKADPMAKAMDEFSQVKTRVVDPQKDLYAPKEARDEGEAHGHHSNDQHDELELHRVTNEHQNADDSEPHFNFGPHELHDQHEEHHFHEEHHAEAYDESHSVPHRAMDPHVVGKIVREEIEEEDLNRKIDEEQDPVRKLQLQLEREQNRFKLLRKQFNENLEELEDVLLEKEKLENAAAGNLVAPPNESVAERSRYEVMKSMWEQATEREEKTDAKLKEVQRQLAAFQHAQTSKDEEDDEDDDDEGKAYEDPAKIVSKLEDRMKSSEPQVSRCQKYYIVLNYPKKVTKKVIKTVARMRLPVGEITDEQVFESLLKFHGELLKNKSAKKAAHEIGHCLYNHGPFAFNTNAAVASAWTAASGSSGMKHYQNGPGDYHHEAVAAISKGDEVPVTYVKTNRRSSSFSRDHHSVIPFNHHHMHHPRLLIPGVPTMDVQQPPIPSAFARVRVNTGANHVPNYHHPR